MKSKLIIQHMSHAQLCQCLNECEFEIWVKKLKKRKKIIQPKWILQTTERLYTPSVPNNAMISSQAD